MALTGAEYSDICKRLTILETFKETADFMQDTFKRNLHTIAYPDSGLSTVHFKIVQFLDSRGEIPTMLAALDGWRAKKEKGAV